MTPDEMLKISYERKCRNHFAHKTKSAKLEALNTFSIELEQKYEVNTTERIRSNLTVYSNEFICLQ